MTRGRGDDASAASTTDRGSAVAVTCAGAFVSAMGASLVTVAAPSIARDLAVPQASVGWVLSAYLLVVSSLLAGVGRVADVHGRRRVYLGGSLLLALGSFACGLAPTLPTLIAARVVQAAGASALMATGPAIITRAFPASKRARGLGIALAATYAGLTLGPTFGGLLTSTFGWHAVFHAITAGAVITAGVAHRLLPRDEIDPATRQPLDLVGSLLFGIALAALLLALRGGSPATRACLVVASVLGFALLARHGASHPAPVLPPSLLATPAFTLGVLGAVLLYVVAFVLTWLLPFHLQITRGMDARHAGLLMTAQPAAMAAVAPLSGWIADRAGPRAPAVSGMLGIAGGMLLVARAASRGSELELLLALAVVGVGAGLFVAPNNAVIMSAAPRERQGTAAAMAATARNVGMTCGVALAVVLHEAVGFASALGAAAAIAVVGALLSVVRPLRVS